MANAFGLDASALVKRYVPETGSALVDEILDRVPGNRIYVLNISAGVFLKSISMTASETLESGISTRVSAMIVG